MRRNKIDIILLSVMGYACYMPAVYLFTDSLLLPKWYLATVAVLVWMIWMLRSKARHCGQGDVWTLARRAKGIVLISSFLECGYVAFMACKEGLSPIGERGTFDNPAGLAVCLCIAVPFAIERLNRNDSLVISGLKMLCVLCLVAVIVLSKSRTGIICLSLFSVIYIWRNVKQKGWVKASILIVIGVAVIMFVVGHKKESTSGRSFILQNTIELIIEKPLFGYGINGFARQYMPKQAAFFAQHKDSEYAMLADEVQHPLNEFAYAWVNYGFAAPVVMLALFVCPAIVAARKKQELLTSLQLSVLAVFVFSMFSYPLHYPLPWCVMIVDVSLCVCSIVQCGKMLKNKVRHIICVMCVAMLALLCHDMWKEYRWNEAWRDLRRNRECALHEYEQLAPYFCNNRYFLYNYAYALFSKGEFLKAISVGSKCERYWNGYNLQLLMGDACRMAGKYEEAIGHYDFAYNMCPSRLAPLEGLYLTHKATHNEDELRRIAERIKRQKVKVPSIDALTIKEKYK